MVEAWNCEGDGGYQTFSQGFQPLEPLNPLSFRFYLSLYIKSHDNWAFSTCPPRISQRINHIPFDHRIVHCQHMGGDNCQSSRCLLSDASCLAFDRNQLILFLSIRHLTHSLIFDGPAFLCCTNSNVMTFVIRWKH
jgi:hypothetical protein